MVAQRGGEVAAKLQVEYGVRRSCVKGRRLEPRGGSAETGCDFWSRDVAPCLPMVTGHLGDRVGGPDPDDAGNEEDRKKTDGRAEHERDDQVRDEPRIVLPGQRERLSHLPESFPPGSALDAPGGAVLPSNGVLSSVPAFFSVPNREGET